MIKFYGATEKPLLYQLINYEVESAANQNRNINPNLEVVLRHIDKSEEGPERLPNHWFSLSQICCSKNQLREAIDFYNKGIDQLEKAVHQLTNLIDLKKMLSNFIQCLAKLRLSNHKTREFVWDGNYSNMVLEHLQMEYSDGKEHYTNHSVLIKSVYGKVSH